mgnify:FL=1
MAEIRKTFQIRQPQDVRYSGHGSGGFTASLEWDAGLAARLNGNLAEAQKYVDQTCIDRMEPETPFRSGTLRDAATLGTVTGSGLIVQSTPYARRQYYEHKKQSKWFERMKNRHKDSIQKEAGKIACGK